MDLVVLPAPQVVVVGSHVLCAHFLDLLLLTLAEDDLEGLHDCLRDVVLNGEHVFHLAVVPLGPQMIAICDVHQLGRDPKPVAHLAHAALEHRRDLQLAPDVSHILALPLEGERRRARGNPERLHLVQRIDDLLGHPVREILVVGIRTHVREREHRNGLGG